MTKFSLGYSDLIRNGQARFAGAELVRNPYFEMSIVSPDMGEEILSHQLDYLYSGVEDAQMTIRAMDIKAGFLFIILCAPAPVLDKILEAAPNFFGVPLFLKLLIIITAVLWMLAAFTLFMSVAAIGNASMHVKGTAPAGTYFGGHLFQLNWTDALAERRRMSTLDVAEELALTPKSESSLVNELVYEKIKLTYIKQIKIKRFAVASKLTVIWIPMMIIASITARFF